ncbi:MAG: type I methionyl aminopeptidase [Prevotellaceae bacterium]|jgi:methionyl aminopeptidase|nr:type I methionyl aminopeptidase [Prevotellaceae bacterium]
MDNIKTDVEIEILRENALLVSRTLAEVAKHIRQGVSTLQLDRVAEQFIRDHGADPGFLGYRGFPNTLCISVNDAVVHGVPSDYCLREGDIVSVDCGTRKNGFYGDSAYTFAVGRISPEAEMLLKVTKESLFKGIAQAVHGNRMGDISNAIQTHVERSGYSVVREMVGHAIGRKMHERPDVPNHGRRGQGPKLLSGMVICIEPMINMGREDIYCHRNDKWTVRTVDGSLSAHYELTVAVGRDRADVLSTFEFVEEVLNNRNLE